MADIIFVLLLTFCGYIVGRFGHCYLNVWVGDPTWFPHHWILGVCLMGIGILYTHVPLGNSTFFFGVGLWFSDLKDFWHFRLFEPDGPGRKRFWDID